MFSMVNTLKRLQKSFPFNHAFIADNAEPENWSTHVDRVSRLSSGMFHNNIKSGDIFGILAVNTLDQATNFEIAKIPLNDPVECQSIALKLTVDSATKLEINDISIEYRPTYKRLINT